MVSQIAMDFFFHRTTILWNKRPHDIVSWEKVNFRSKFDKSNLIKIVESKV